MIFSPGLRVLCTPYPDLAGVLMRDWQREGFLVIYRHDRTVGFVIIAVRPRWRWVPRLIFRGWFLWQPLAELLGLVSGVGVGLWLLWFLTVGVP